MKPAEIRSLNAEQREERLQELHTEWRDLRFQEAVGQLTATARTRQIRKDIARILTIQGEAARQQVATAEGVIANTTAASAGRTRRVRLRTLR